MSIEQSKVRNVFLDIFKFFLCFLVISIHFVGEAYPHFPLYRPAVAVVLSKLITFDNLMLKSTCTLIVSFIIYELCYLILLLRKEIIARKKNEVKYE